MGAPGHLGRHTADLASYIFSTSYQRLSCNVRGQFLPIEGQFTYCHAPSCVTSIFKNLNGVFEFVRRFCNIIPRFGIPVGILPHFRKIKSSNYHII